MRAGRWQVYTSKYRKVRIYKVKGVSQISKRYLADPANRACDRPGSWYCPGADHARPRPRPRPTPAISSPALTAAALSLGARQHTIVLKKQVHALGLPHWHHLLYPTGTISTARLAPLAPSPMPHWHHLSPALPLAYRSGCS